VLLGDARLVAQSIGVDAQVVRGELAAAGGLEGELGDGPAAEGAARRQTWYPVPGLR